jgi:hypothetical protein
VGYLLLIKAPELENNLQATKQEKSRQNPLLSNGSLHTPRHRKWEAKDQKVEKHIGNAIPPEECHYIDTMTWQAWVPEFGYWRTPCNCGNCARDEVCNDQNAGDP